MQVPPLVAWGRSLVASGGSLLPAFHGSRDSAALLTLVRFSQALRLIRWERPGFVQWLPHALARHGLRLLLATGLVSRGMPLFFVAVRCLSAVRRSVPRCNGGPGIVVSLLLQCCCAFGFAP